MQLYWVLFSLIAFFSISDIKLDKNLKYILNFIFLLFLTLFIGLRHEVGGDWDIYKYDFQNNVIFFDLSKLNYVRDFGYEFLSFICFKLDLGIYGLNLILSLIFVYSLNKFIIQLKNNYWLLYLISFPYLIIIVSMGYTRQAAGLSFMLLALCSLNDKKLIPFLIYSLTAIMFHKSSAIMLPLIFISYFKINFNNFFIFLILSVVAYFTIIPEIDRISSGYLNVYSKYQSSGVSYRISLNILAGTIFLFFYSKLKFNSKMDNLIIIIFFCNIGLFLLIDNYSTFVDRIIIYFTFIQLIVFSRLYLILPNFKTIINILVIFLYALIFYIWINFSYHSYLWLPYKNILFMNFR